MSDSLWDDEDADPLDNPRWAATKETRLMARSARYIGCPVEWLKRALPAMRSAEQLAVALYIG